MIHKKYLTNKYFAYSLVTGIVFLFVSLVVEYFASDYATDKQSNAVTDIILSNIPIFNVADIFVYGFFAVIIFIIILCLIKPQRMLFILKSTSVFILIRSVFITMTHVGIYPNIVATNLNIFKSITSGGDLFFSGHVGFPFLMALIFWPEKKLRYSFVSISVILGILALLGHYHYTIDVMAAYFITFGIYHICLKWFKKDHQILLNDIN